MIRKKGQPVEAATHKTVSQTLKRVAAIQGAKQNRRLATVFCLGA